MRESHTILSATTKNLSYNVSELELRELFAQAGEIKKVAIIAEGKDREFGLASC